jgi:hypothetical protein
MKEQLIALLAERVNLSEEVATKAVDTMFDFFKDNPDEVAKLLGTIASSGPLSGLGKLFG